MRIKWILLVSVVLWLPKWADGQVNVKIDSATRGDYVCEPAIAINPKDPLNLVAASVKDNVYTSFDGGKTWKKQKVTSPYGVYGDPVLIADSKGNFYFFHLSDPTGEGWQNEKSLDHIVCHVSKDGGVTWDEGSSIGYNAPKDQDKPWVTIDNKDNLHVTWTQFDKYNDKSATCQSNIMISSSSNGRKWSKPVVLSGKPGNCLDDDATAEGAVPAISFDERQFVAWAVNEKIYLDRSFDGNLWLSSDIEVTTQKGGWNLDVPGHDRTNGMPVLTMDSNPKSPRRGTIYLTFADQRNGVDNTDVWLLRSSNYGDNWTSAFKIGMDDDQRHQYLPWSTVDQSNGALYILYYSRSGHTGAETDVWLSWSTDGGHQFKHKKISEKSFVPTAESFFGDYLGISAVNGTIAAIWARMDNGKTSVVTTTILESELNPPVETAGKKKKKKSKD